MSQSVWRSPSQVGYASLLGEPLPHQLANTTQVHLVMQLPLKQMSCSIYSYAVIAIVLVIPRYQTGYCTRYSPTSQLIRSVQAPSFAILLACIRHAASVDTGQDQTLDKSLSSRSFLSLADLLFSLLVL